MQLEEKVQVLKKEKKELIDKYETEIKQQQDEHARKKEALEKKVARYRTRIEKEHVTEAQ